MARENKKGKVRIHLHALSGFVSLKSTKISSASFKIVAFRIFYARTDIYLDVYIDLCFSRVEVFTGSRMMPVLWR